MISPPSQPFGSDATEPQSVYISAESHDQPISAGMILQHARESTGMPISALAFSLKVPVNKLEALEMDRHDLLPDTVFARALASSVCRTLKLDPAPVLALLPRSMLHSYRQDSVTAPASFSAYPSAARPFNRSSVSGTALMAGLLLVAGAAILVFLPIIKEAAMSFNTRGLLGSGSGVKAVLLASSRPDVTGDSAIANNLVRGAVNSSPASLSLAPATLPMLQLAQTIGSIAVPIAPVPSMAGLSAAADLSSNRVVTFTAATQSSWVKVTDAKGAVVLSRTIAPGEAVFAAGALPLSVIVGRADATRVQVRGQAFDLAAYSRDNVARFEVK